MSTSSISSLKEGATLDKTTCTKVGNVVSVSGRLTNLTEAANGSFFTIPSGFRPRSTIYANGYITVDGVFTPMFLTISSAGDVAISYSASRQLTQIFFSATYAV